MRCLWVGFLFVLLGCSPPAKVLKKSNIQQMNLFSSSQNSTEVVFGGEREEIQRSALVQIEAELFLLGQSSPLFEPTTTLSHQSQILQIHQVSVPQRLRIQAFRGDRSSEIDFIADFESLEKLSNGGSIWVGSVQGFKYGTVRLSFYKSAMYGLIDLGHVIYRISQFSSDVYQIIEVDPSKIKRFADDGFLLEGHDSDEGSQLEQLSQREGALIDGNDKAIGIRVDFAFTQSASQFAGGVNSLVSQFNLGLSLLNLSFSNSEVNAYAFLGTFQSVDYTEGQSLPAIHQDMILDQIPNLPNMGRSIVLAVGTDDPDHDGFATVGGEHVVIEAFYLGDLLLAHEIGHNLGATHEESVQFRNDHVSVMAADGHRDPWFSNPFVNYLGKPAGDYFENFSAMTICEGLGENCLAIYEVPEPSIDKPDEPVDTDNSNGGSTGSGSGSGSGSAGTGNDGRDDPISLSEGHYNYNSKSYYYNGSNAFCQHNGYNSSFQSLSSSQWNELNTERYDGYCDGGSGSGSGSSGGGSSISLGAGNYNYNGNTYYFNGNNAYCKRGAYFSQYRSLSSQEWNHVSSKRYDGTCAADSSGGSGGSSGGSGSGSSGGGSSISLGAGNYNRGGKTYYFNGNNAYCLRGAYFSQYRSLSSAEWSYMSSKRYDGSCN